MAREKMSYSFSGYKYAPESFHVAKGVAGGKREEIPLSDVQRKEAGYLYLTKGKKFATDYVKRIERKRERECHIYVTYGFFSHEAPQTYLYCQDIRCGINAPLNERAMVFKKFIRDMKRTDGKVEQSTQCLLDGQYRPVHIEKKYLTADFNRPVVIRLIRV